VQEKMMKRSVTAVLALILLCGCQSCGCRSTKSHAEPKLRDGVVDIPVAAAPQELWIAANVWQQPTSSVGVVVMSLNDGSRRVTYFLDIGFEGSDWNLKRDSFHTRLETAGWRPVGEPQEHAGTYSSQGRRLCIGYDTGRHPTTLVVSYEKESTQPTSAGDSSPAQVRGLGTPEK
jgi:hypothetical protein